MAGTSGCIPDYHVNFFSQLCQPASHPSRMTSPEPGPQLDFEQQSNNTPVPSCTADHAPAPDPVAEMFKENQNLIRGLSCGNIETYLATIKDVFTAVRQSRKNAFTEMPREQRLAEHYQVGQGEQNQAECPDQHPLTNGNQHQTHQQIDPEYEHTHPYKEQCQLQQACRCQEHLARQESRDQDQHQHQHQPRLQNPHKYPAHNFIVTHYPKNKDNTKLPRQAISPRSITAGRRYHAMHAIQ